MIIKEKKRNNVTRIRRSSCFFLEQHLHFNGCIFIYILTKHYKSRVGIINNTLI